MKSCSQKHCYILLVQIFFYLHFFMTFMFEIYMYVTEIDSIARVFFFHGILYRAFFCIGRFMVNFMFCIIFFRACFKRLPRILCFNTMRYTFNMVTMLKEKVNTHFSFPLRLDMSQYMEKNLMGPDKLKGRKAITGPLFNIQSR